MNDSLWTFVFELANFVALAALLAWLFFKPARRALEDEAERAQRTEEQATGKLAEAERLHQEIESKHEALATELEVIRSKAIEAAKQEAQQLVVEGRQQIERERAALKRESLHIEQAQTAKLARAVAAATRNTMTRFLRQIEGPGLEQALIAAACRELRTLSNNSLAPVIIESATPLDDNSRQLISSSLAEAAKSAIFRVVPELGGGVRISTAHGLVDASINGLADFAEQSLSAEIQAIIREESAGE